MGLQIQQIFSAILSASKSKSAVSSSCLWDFSRLCLSYPGSANSVKDIFNFSQRLLAIVLKANILLVFWFHQIKIVALMNYIVRVDFEFVCSRLQKIIFSKYTQIFLLVIKLPLIALPFFKYGINNQWGTNMLADAHSAMFLPQSNCSTKKYDFVSDIPTCPSSVYVLIVFGYITSFHSRFYLFFPDDYMYLIVTVMYAGACSFAKYVKSPKKHSWKQIISHYGDVFDLSMHIN